MQISEYELPKTSGPCMGSLAPFFIFYPAIGRFMITGLMFVALDLLYLIFTRSGFGFDGSFPRQTSEMICCILFA